MKILFRQYLELVTWVAALILLAFMNPSSGAHHSLCIFKFMGFEFCPGCGIGHSINYLLHGDFYDDELSQFCMIYRSKRKDPQLILILCLLGLVGIAGLQRFIIGHVGMGVLYFFTAGLCFIGTIVDTINHKELALEYNAKMITETLSMLNMIR